MCLHLFHKFYDGESKIRRAFVTLTNLNDEVGTQLDLFENQVKKKCRGSHGLHSRKIWFNSHSSGEQLYDGGNCFRSKQENRWAFCIEVVREVTNCFFVMARAEWGIDK